MKIYNFWKKINTKCQKEKRPILVMAPMAGITDSAFRQLCREYGADVVYSEMASVNALKYAPEKTIEMLKFEKKERPYVVQLFGSEPENFELAVKIIQKEIKPDGIDINFGCPVPKVAKQKAGAELFKDLKQSRKVIKAVLKVATVPVSIKIRKQVGEIEAIDFLKNIFDLPISTIMIHGRAFSQMHSGPVDAKYIKKCKKYFKGIVIANGGISDYDSGMKLWSESEADGIAIGQGALGKPWLFESIKSKICKVKSQKEIFKVALKHSKLAHKLKGEQGIVEMRKHLCWYVQGMPNAKELRRELVFVNTLKEINEIFKNSK